ncbi:MAG: hypothetical protein HYU57_07940 [Micavibrio aeruginosavorus]|nr:hypothetical protein [Micavibrio aeruginosavorus]
MPPATNRTSAFHRLLLMLIVLPLLLPVRLFAAEGQPMRRVPPPCRRVLTSALPQSNRERLSES